MPPLPQVPAETRPIRIDLILHRLSDKGIEFRLGSDFGVIRIDGTGPEPVETVEDAPSIRHAAARLAHLVLEPGERVSEVYLRRVVKRWD